jgi:hypothetical protein
MNTNYAPLQDLRLRPYLEDVYAWHGYVRFLGLPTLQDHPDTPLHELFVAPLLSTQPVSPDSDPGKWPSGEGVLSLLQQVRRLVVLGDPGGGKSTLINWLAWLLVSGVSERVPDWLQGAIPLPLILRELDLTQANTFEGLLKAFLHRPVAQHLKGKEELLLSMLKAGNVLVLADGLDEVGTAQRETLRQALLDGFVRYPNSLFLITSRIVGYNDCPLVHDQTDGDEKKLGGVAVGGLAAAGLAAAGLAAAGLAAAGLAKSIIDAYSQRMDIHAHLRYVMPFDDDRVRFFAGNWYRLRSLKQTADNDAAEFIQALFRDQTTLRLARTPQLLTLMALIYRVRAQLPDGRALLYDLITEAYLESIDKARKLENDRYPWREKRRWLARVGFEMQYRRSQIDGDEPELIARRKEVQKWVAEAMQVSGYQADAPFVDSYLDWVARRSGLLLPRGEDQFAFVHLSFQEYFAALFLVEHLVDADWVLSQRDGSIYPEGDQRVNATNLRDWANEPRWQETLVFAFESFAHQPKDAKRLVVWLYGDNYKEFQKIIEHEAKRQDSPTDYPALSPSAELLARVMIDPHSGLPELERSNAFDALWKYFEIGEGRFGDNVPALYSSPKVLRRILESQYWADVFWSRLAICNPKRLSLSACGSIELRLNNSFSNLSFLEIFDTKILNFTSLTDMENLRGIGLSTSDIDDISQLKLLANLENLILFAPVTDDLSPLAQLPKLEKLTLLGPASLDLTPLKHCPRLVRLFIIGIKLSTPVPKTLRKRLGKGLHIFE